MPTISIKKRLLDKHLTKCYTKDEIDELCFQYGLELDDVVVERAESGEEDEVYKIEIPANRYDLLCVEGLARSLLVFQKKLQNPHYKLAKVKKPAQILVESETAKVRKFVVGAILRDVEFDKDVYASFIDLQDKLHQNIGRKRTLASIGTHDMDSLKFPVHYRALPPKDIRFKPLNQEKTMDAVEMMEFYAESHLREYLPIIRNQPVYPVIEDADGTVLSMPPIINSDHSKISLTTKNIFIEATGTDLRKLEITLDTVVSMFSQYCKQPFVVEPVEVVSPDGSVQKYPLLPYRDQLVDVRAMAAKVGIKVDVEQAVELLSKMGLSCTKVKDQHSIKLQVTIPPTRQDILHECDIAEDLALAYGFNNIPLCLPEAHTVATPFPLNKLTDQLRREVAQCAWTEVLSFTLCSTDDVSTKLRKPGVLDTVVKIANPKTLEFQVVRNSLLPGILKTIAHNKDMPLPLRLFEVQDVVFIDKAEDTNCRNERHLAAVFYSKHGAFEVIHGLLDRVMEVLDVPFSTSGEKGYCIKETNDPTFFEGRCAEVVFAGKSIGTFGILHPEVLSNFALVNPCSAIEINIEPFL